MLSVQSPGYAGMERLGTPGGPGGGGPNRNHQRHINDLNIPSMTTLQYNMLLGELGVRNVHHSEPPNCPPHIALPDGEQGQDRDRRIRTDDQYRELTRSAIQPPPNRTVQDVPNYIPPVPPPNNRKPASPHKKEGRVQKTFRDFKLFVFSKKGGEATMHPETVEAEAVADVGGGGVTVAPAPCVMVPKLRPPPAPAPPPPAPPAPPTPPHAPPS